MGKDFVAGDIKEVFKVTVSLIAVSGTPGVPKSKHVSLCFGKKSNWEEDKGEQVFQILPHLIILLRVFHRNCFKKFSATDFLKQLTYIPINQFIFKDNINVTCPDVNNTEEGVHISSLLFSTCLDIFMLAVHLVMH